MRKDELQYLKDISKIQKNQFYLLQNPNNIHQQFIHMFAHRHLLTQNMINKNIQNIVNLFPGSFTNQSLSILYVTSCIQNQISLQNNFCHLQTLINGWINFYPTVKRDQKLKITQIVLQDLKEVSDIGSYHTYLAYLNLISIDLWKLLRKNRDQDQFWSKKSIKEELEQIILSKFNHIDAGDLLTLLASCLSKILINIILDPNSAPQGLRDKNKKLQCLYSNKQTQYFLRTSLKLPILLKNTIMVILTMKLSVQQQKWLMINAMKYYYSFHFDRELCAPQILIYSFNKCNDQARKSLRDQFSLFFKTIIKLGKQKLLIFLENNSSQLKEIIQQIRKNPKIGYTLQSASPFNALELGNKIIIERGAKIKRYFEIIQHYSILYIKVIVQSMDISFKISYLGDIGSKKVLQKVVYRQQKVSKQVTSCFHSLKRGLYEIEFDNQYSWLNSKNVIYQILVFAPLEIKSSQNTEWVQSYYEMIYQNELSKKQNIKIIQQKKIEQSSQQLIKANIIKNNDNFLIQVKRGKINYQYQTDNPQRMEQKVYQFFKNKQKYSWNISNRTLKDPKDIIRFIRGQTITNFIQDQKIKQFKQEQIEEESQVIGKKLQQSMIVQQENNRPKNRQLTTKTSLREDEKKQKISFTLQEVEDLYKKEE